MLGNDFMNGMKNQSVQPEDYLLPWGNNQHEVTLKPGYIMQTNNGLEN